jgi:hypothetical protein
VSSKRDGLEKAVYRIEQAIKKKSRNHGSQSEDDQNTIHLQNLLNEAQGLLPTQSPDIIDPAFRSQDVRQHQHSLLQHNQLGLMTGPEQNGVQNQDDHFSVDDAENPLQLLARASDLSGPPNQASYTPNLRSPISLSRHVNSGRDLDLQNFFGPFRPSLDIGSENDPIDMGLVTEDESVALFR